MARLIKETTILYSEDARSFEEKKKVEILDKLSGAWDNPDGDLMEKAIKEGRQASYVRKIASFTD